MPNVVRRNLLFFTTQLRDPKTKKLVADPAAAWKALKKMPYKSSTKVHGRSREIGNGTFEAVDVWNLDSRNTVEGRVYRTKMSDLPTVGIDDVDRLLELPDGGGLRYSTHFVWWDLSTQNEKFGVPQRKEGLLVAEFNKDAPRATALENYVYTVLGGKYVLDVQPIAHVDAFTELAKHQNLVKSLTIRVPYHDFGGSFQSKGSLSGLYLGGKGGGVESIEVTARPGWGKSLDITADIKKLKQMANSPREGMKLKAALDDDQTLDLIHSVIKLRTDEVEVIGKSVVSKEMLKQIRNSVDKHRDDLGRALGRNWADADADDEQDN